MQLYPKLTLQDISNILAAYNLCQSMLDLCKRNGGNCGLPEYNLYGKFDDKCGVVKQICQNVHEHTSFSIDSVAQSWIQTTKGSSWQSTLCSTSCRMCETRCGYLRPKFDRSCTIVDQMCRERECDRFREEFKLIRDFREEF